MKDQMQVALTCSGAIGAPNGVPVGSNLSQTAQYIPYYEDTKQSTTKAGMEDTYADQESNRIGKAENTNRSRATAGAYTPGTIPSYGYDRTLYNADVGKQTQD
jgi:hypothetical protein